MEQKQNDTFNKNVNRHLSCLCSDAAIGNKSNRKTERDKATIRLMIDIYCRHRLGLMETPERFKALADYACRRLDHCRWGEAKPACKDCPVHCYAPKKREEIRQVMCWAGPRMILHSPMAALRHLCQCLMNKTRLLRQKSSTPSSEHP